MRRRPALIAGAFALVLGAPAAVLAAGTPAGWWGASAALLAAGASVPAVLWLERAKRGETTFPKVSDMDEPLHVGVHKARPHPSGPPAYIPRDIDGELRDALGRSGFVLLSGDSTAGKTRAAYEAMRSVLPRHAFLAPGSAEALPTIVAETARRRRAVLWLDDLERFLGEGGLDAETVADLIRSPGHTVVLATIRARELARLRPEDGDEPLGHDRGPRALLALAHEIPLGRPFTAAERDRGGALAADPRIEAALDQAEQFGVAEYLAAGPEALKVWCEARLGGSHRRAAALVSAAVDLRRTAAVLAAAPRELIEELHHVYLRADGGDRLPAESLEEAWAWLARPVHATALLLWPDPDDPGSLRVFDYLVDEVQGDDSAALVPETLYLTVFPRLEPWHRQLVLLLVMPYRPDLALRLRSMILDLDPQTDPQWSHTIALTIAFVLSAEGRAEEAVAVLRESLAVIETGERVTAELVRLLRFTLGGMLLVVGDMEEGLALMADNAET